jgi:hypothetical protein
MLVGIDVERLDLLHHRLLVEPIDLALQQRGQIAPRLVRVPDAITCVVADIERYVVANVLRLDQGLQHCLEELVDVRCPRHVAVLLPSRGARRHHGNKGPARDTSARRGWLVQDLVVGDGGEAATRSGRRRRFCYRR